MGKPGSISHAQMPANRFMTACGKTISSRLWVVQSGPSCVRCVRALAALEKTDVR